MGIKKLRIVDGEGLAMEIVGRDGFEEGIG